MKKIVFILGALRFTVIFTTKCSKDEPLETDSSTVKLDSTNIKLAPYIEKRSDPPP